MWLKLGKKSRTASHNSKFTDSYKKRVNIKKIIKIDYAYYFIVYKSDNNLLFVNRKQTNYFKIGKFCLY